jgi:hypothetical protein
MARKSEPQTRSGINDYSEEDVHRPMAICAKGYLFMREIEISRCTRAESKDYRISKRLEDLVTD